MSKTRSNRLLTGNAALEYWKFTGVQNNIFMKTGIVIVLKYSEFTGIQKFDSIKEKF